MTKNYDVLIIGSGPSGIMSAVKLQDSGLKIALVDESFKLGGQIYKNIEENCQSQQNKTLFGQDYTKGLDLIKKLDLSKIDYIDNASVWSIDKNKNVFYSKNNTSTKISAKKIIIATGAMERPFPVVGWTKPGVVSATSAQILLKESSIVQDNGVFVGSGPLFYYVISQYIDAGAKIKAIVDTTALENYFSSFKYLPRALKKVGYLLKGLGFFYKFKKHNIKMHLFAKNVAFCGNNSLEKVTFDDNKSIQTDLAFIHNGLVPNINLQLQAGCAYEYSHKRKCIEIKTNNFKESSVDGIFVVGDGEFVKGVDLSMIEAKIVALKISLDFGNISQGVFEHKYKEYQKELKHHSSIRDFLDKLYLPHINYRVPINEDVVVCRCEEVKLSAVKNSLKIDKKGLNTIKTFTRVGMGNCQSRFCGLTLLEIVAKETNRPIEELSYLNIRTPIKPVRIEELANLK